MKDRRRQRVRVYVPDTEASERMGMARRLTAKPGFDARFGDDLMASAEAVEENLGDAEIVCVALGRVSASAIESASDLRLVVKCGIGVDNIDCEAAERRGIPVLRVAGVNFRGVAEYVIGAIIGLNRQMVALDRAVRAGEWKQLRGVWTGRLPALTGTTLGIIGVGSIGAEVARLAGATEWSCWASIPTSILPGPPGSGSLSSKKEELLERADVVSVHVLLDDSTRGMLSDREFRRMKPTALLVNSARGPIVDEAALARALAENEIAAAALDVFEEEPLDPASPLVTLEELPAQPASGWLHGLRVRRDRDDRCRADR